jgi:hypothetical protein
MSDKTVNTLVFEGDISELNVNLFAETFCGLKPSQWARGNAIYEGDKKTQRIEELEQKLAVLPDLKAYEKLCKLVEVNEIKMRRTEKQLSEAKLDIEKRQRRANKRGKLVTDLRIKIKQLEEANQKLMETAIKQEEVNTYSQAFANLHRAGAKLGRAVKRALKNQKI